MKLLTIAKPAMMAVKKRSPEILLVTGIVGVIGATVMACRATTKAHIVKEAYKETLQDIEFAKEHDKTYSEEDERKDKMIATVQAAWGYVKVYGPSVTLGLASIGSILAGHNILKKRNAALLAAYKAVEQAFSDYRGRVVEDVGIAKDAQYRFDTTEKIVEEVITDENGKKKKVKKTEISKDGIVLSEYARLFGPELRNTYSRTWEGSTMFSPVHAYNINTITAKMNHFNDLYNAGQIVTLNYMLEELGFPPTLEGQFLCIRRDHPNTKGGVDLLKYTSLFTHVDGEEILIDFDIDGYIYDDLANTNLKQPMIAKEV